MDFDYTPKVKELQKRVRDFLEEHIVPAEQQMLAQIAEGDRWSPPPLMDELKQKARAAGLWNLWQPRTHGGTLTNLEYAPLAEIMGRSPFGSEPFNCSAPDTGNMEVLLRYGTEEQKKQWLEPLLDGRIRSAFAMTEPAVGCSDAPNNEARSERPALPKHHNGRQWGSAAAPAPRG
ncbi:MAG: acyl-CoA dehydrogenase family protein, partial [Betaproteobacteria bacterium]